MIDSAVRPSKNDAIAELIPLYLTACEAEGKSPATLCAYRETLKLFQTVIATDGLPGSASAFTTGDVYRYIAAIRRRGVADSTQHRRHREVKHFFSWLRRMEIVNDNVFQKVPLIRLEQKVVQPFTPEDLQRILASCSAYTELDTRLCAMVLFLVDTGVRASELVGLNLEDLDLVEGRAKVMHGKGRKQRIVAFGPFVTDAVLRYVDFRGSERGPLFRSLRGDGRMTRHALQQCLEKLERETGIERIHAHRFRHTFATIAIRSAAREIDVQHLLGHSTSAMVRRYTRTYDAEQAAIAHHQWSPARSMLGGLATTHPAQAIET